MYVKFYFYGVYLYSKIKTALFATKYATDCEKMFFRPCSALQGEVDIYVFKIWNSNRTIKIALGSFAFSRSSLGNSLRYNFNRCPVQLHSGS